MNKLLTALLGLGVLLGTTDALATPEQDRQAFIKHYTQKYPNIKVDDYVYGALAFDDDSRAQYNSIMEFPPYESVVDQGRKMWETPFQNGKRYADCFPNGGKQIAGTYPQFDDAKGKVVTLQDALKALRALAKRTSIFSFGAVPTQDWGERATYFSALLEGVKAGDFEARQLEMYGEIVVMRQAGRE